MVPASMRFPWPLGRADFIAGGLSRDGRILPVRLFTADEHSSVCFVVHDAGSKSSFSLLR